MIRSILAADLPGLDNDRLDEVTAFVERRIDQLVGPA